VTDVGQTVNTCDQKRDSEIVLIEDKTSKECKPLKSAVRDSEGELQMSQSRDKVQAMLV
jgi:hypothetical protein